MPGWLVTWNPEDPQGFDLGRVRREGRPVESWEVKQYRREMAPGDPFAIWQTGEHGGVIAVGKVTGAPFGPVTGSNDDCWGQDRGKRWMAPVSLNDGWTCRSCGRTFVRIQSSKTQASSLSLAAAIHSG